MGADGSGITRAEFDELRRRIEQAEARLNRGDTTLALLDERLKSITDKIQTLSDTSKDKLNELSLDIQEIKSKPAKRWDAVVSQVVSWAVALMLGYIAIRIS